MYKRTWMLGLLVAVFSLSLHSALADDAVPERGTKDEAIALVKKAVAYYKANDHDKALAEFSDPHGQFIEKDMYLCVNDIATGLYIADGKNKALVGRNLLDVEDVHGKFYVKERVETAKLHDSFWMDYMFTDPIEKKLAPKHSYCESTDGIVICAGVYTNQ
jgi:cytochrome c